MPSVLQSIQILKVVYSSRYKRVHVQNYGTKGQLSLSRMDATKLKTYLHIGKVNPVEIAEHLVDLGGVLQDRTGRLRQMIQRRVSAEGLSKGTNSGYLRKRGWPFWNCDFYSRQRLSLSACLDKTTGNIHTLTLVWIIVWGMLLMALVSQPSRLLAKLRMAWVKAPVEHRWRFRFTLNRGQARYTTSQKFVNCKIFNVFKRFLFCSASLHLFDPKYNSKSLKYFYYLK